MCMHSSFCSSCSSSIHYGSLLLPPGRLCQCHSRVYDTHSSIPVIMAPKKKTKEEQEAERLRLEEEAKAAEQGTKLASLQAFSSVLSKNSRLQSLM
jgi:hypothetical protein